MQYMLLIYDQESTWQGMSEDERNGMMQEYFQFSEDLRKSGKHVAGDALKPLSTAKSVRVREGSAETTDGPFAETKEALGGYYLIEARDLDQALELGALCPTANLEIRPVLDTSGPSV